VVGVLLVGVLRHRFCSRVFVPSVLPDFIHIRYSTYYPGPYHPFPLCSVAPHFLLRERPPFLFVSCCPGRIDRDCDPLPRLCARRDYGVGHLRLAAAAVSLAVYPGVDLPIFFPSRCSRPVGPPVCVGRAVLSVRGGGGGAARARVVVGCDPCARFGGWW